MSRKEEEAGTKSEGEDVPFITTTTTITTTWRGKSIVTNTTTTTVTQNHNSPITASTTQNLELPTTQKLNSPIKAFRYADDYELQYLRSLNTVQDRKGNKMLFEGTQEEYYAALDNIDEMLKQPSAPGQDEVDRSMCLKCFEMIQQQKPDEMGDCELVGETAISFIMACAPWIHMNFYAKCKGEDDSPAALYFAEFDMTKHEVVCLAKVHMEPSAGTTPYKCCGFCYPPDTEDDECVASGSHIVYHPVDGGPWCSRAPRVE